MTWPLASIAARARWIEAGPFGAQPVPWSRMYCNRTGAPTAFASTAASMAQSSASLRPYDPGPVVQMTCTLSAGICRIDAMPCCTKCDFCVPVQHGAVPSLIWTSAQAGPMQACDWNGHSYSASMTLAAVLNASSTLPFSLSTERLRTVALRMWSYSEAWVGNGGAVLDHSTLSLPMAWMASHSRGATTPRKPSCHTTLTPGMSLTELSSTFVGTAPATAGRIMRACSMPGTFTSVTKSSWAKTFGATSSRLMRWPTILWSLGSFGLALPGA